MGMSELNQKEVNEQMYLFVKRWLDDLPFEESKKVPVMAIGYCLARLSKQDELLKEQEAIKPEWYDGTPFCGNCGHRLEKKNRNMKEIKCPTCGKAVKWG